MVNFWIKSIAILIWINFSRTINPVLGDSIFRVDPLALLSDTLRIFQKTGCDSEFISLSCPRGTSISIEIAQYGKPGGEDTVDSICPAATDNIIFDRMHSGTEIEIKTPESCLWPNALQYSLLQTVVEACQKKTHCKFLAMPKSFRGDPCPGIRRFVDVSYKCRPYEFRSKVACENDVIQLICNPYSRIAVYSASYGRTEYESLQCSQPQGVREETCLVSYATEKVMGFCHGQRRCNLSADAHTFGNPCRPDSRMYLKVVYTCVPRKVLGSQYESPLEADEPNQTEIDNNVDEIYDDDQFYRESEAIPPAPKLQGEITKIQRTSSDATVLDTPSSVDPPLKSSKDGNSLEEDQERLYMYLIICVTASIVICLTLVIGRLVFVRREAKEDAPKMHQSTTGETTLPNGFNDDISEIDADIDLTTPIPIISVSRNETSSMSTYNPSVGSYPSSMVPPPNISQSTQAIHVPGSSIIGVGGPNSCNRRAGSVYIPPHSMSSPMGQMQPLNHMNTLPHRSVHPSYITSSIFGHGTLRRPLHDVENTMPRSLSRGGDNTQYYYG